MENREYHLHASVRGASHARKGIGCEDSAGSAQVLEGIGLAFAVADGHGDPACSRSALGSHAAVEVVIKRLEEFSRELKKRLPTAAELDELGRGIVGTWRASVLSHYEANPLGSEEAAQLGNRGLRIAERRPEHLYGTTLLAGLLLPQALVLVQQGDGCCVIIDERGEATCPLPEDDRCVGNMTTSLCDGDAAEHIRCMLLDCADGKPVACFMGTDGVDKSLVGEDGLKDYCVELALELVDVRPGAKTNAHVEEQLAMLSEQGAGDDTSLAGFLNPCAVKTLEPVLRERLQVSGQLAEMSMLADKLNSMQRRRDKYLNMVPTSAAEQESRDAFLNEYAELEQRLYELETLTGRTLRDPTELSEPAQVGRAEAAPVGRGPAAAVSEPAQVGRAQTMPIERDPAAAVPDSVQVGRAQVRAAPQGPAPQGAQPLRGQGFPDSREMQPAQRGRSATTSAERTQGHRRQSHSEQSDARGEEASGTRDADASEQEAQSSMPERRVRGKGPLPKVAKGAAKFSRRDIILAVSIGLSVLSLALVAFMFVFVLHGGEGETQIPLEELAAQNSGDDSTSEDAKAVRPDTESNSSADKSKEGDDINVEASNDVVAPQVVGAVLVSGDQSGQYNGALGWKDVKSVAAGENLVVGLLDGGTLRKAGSFLELYDVSDWRGVKAISACGSVVAGLLEDGTVRVAGPTADQYGQGGQLDVSGMARVEAVAAGDGFVCLLGSGTAVVVGPAVEQYAGQEAYGGQDPYDVSDWRGVKAISACGSVVAGLFADGTVRVAGDVEGRYATADQTSEDGRSTTNGQAAEDGGTVSIDLYATGGQSGISNWRDVVEVAVGKDCIVGLARRSVTAKDLMDSNGTDGDSKTRDKEAESAAHATDGGSGSSASAGSTRAESQANAADVGDERHDVDSHAGAGSDAHEADVSANSEETGEGDGGV